MKGALFPRALLVVAVGTLVFAGAPLAADVFEVDIWGDEGVLYTDPNTGNQIRTGGFSGLCPVPGDETGTLFYVVSDRGPGGDGPDGGKFFAVLDYTPTIYTIELQPGGVARIINALPLKKPSGELVTGIPNPCVPHESPLIDLNGNDITDLMDSDSLDPEGITVDENGIFWLCEEFRPSVFAVAPDGTVLLRLVPEGTLYRGDEEIPTLDVLPGILSKRVTNKGFESLEIARNGKLFVMMQRPLANPDKATSDSSRSLRFLRINLPKLLRGNLNGVFHQYLYVTEETTKQKSTYISSLHSLTPDLFIGAERRTNQVYAFNIEDATEITRFEDSDGRLRADPSRTLEELSPDELAAMGIVTAAKTLLIDETDSLDPSLGKAEGIALVGSTLVLVGDNDFNVDEEAMDFSVQPAKLGLQDPWNLPKIVTTMVSVMH